MTFINHPSEKSTPFGSRLLLVPILLSISVAGSLFIVEQSVFAILILLASLIGFATLIWPDLITLAVIFIIYTNAAIVSVKFHGLPYIVGASIPFLLVIPVIYYLVFYRQKLIIIPIFAFVFLFHVVQVFGALFSINIFDAADTLERYFIEGLLLYFLLTNAVRNMKMLRQAVWVLLIAGAFMGGITFYQQVTETYGNNYGGFAQLSDAAFGTGVETIQGEVHQPRLAGPLGQQNRYAQIMVMLIPLGMFRFWGEQSKTLRILAAIATGLTVLGMSTAFSRGAALAFGVVILIVVLMRYIKPRQIAVLVLGLFLLGALIPQYRARLLSLQGLVGLFSEENVIDASQPDGSIRGRATSIMTAALVFADHPIIGVGPGMFGYHYQDYAKFVGPRWQEGNRDSHNLYMGIAADNGVLGFLLFMGILFLTMHGLVRARKRWIQADPDIANLATGFLLAIVAYMVSGIPLHFGYVRFFWVIMALAGATSYLASIHVKPEFQVTND